MAIIYTHSLASSIEADDDTPALGVRTHLISLQQSCSTRRPKASCATCPRLRSRRALQRPQARGVVAALIGPLRREPPA